MVDDAVALFRALADPLRWRILHLLSAGELCVGDVVAVLRVPQPTASRHLTSLRKAGLVTARKHSYWTFYALTPATSPLSRAVRACLAADRRGRSRDQKPLAALKRKGGCCPR